MKNTQAKLLVVDDDDNNRYLLHKLLVRDGYQNIGLAEDGVEALAILDSQNVDLVLLDIRMPRMDGHQVLRHMKSDEVMRSIPVIIITVLDDIQNAANCIELGADDYLPIPYNPVVLRARVHASLERRRLQKVETANLELRYRGLTDMTLDGIIILDESGCVDSVNAAAESIFDRGREEMEGLAFKTLIADWPDEPTWSEFISGNYVGAHVAAVGHRSSGSFSLELAAQLLGRDQSKCIAINVRDLTEREDAKQRHLELEQRLMQAQKMESIGRLAGGVAHDFNNILSVIAGYCELLRSEPPVTEADANSVEQILAAVSRGSALTNQLLTFSRNRVLETQIIDVNELILNLRSMFERLIGDDIALDFDLSQDIRSIVADQSQIERVIMNLVANANDAMPNGGRVKVCTAEVSIDAGDIPNLASGPYARIDVVDNGVGIDPDILGAIFEPFFTTKDTGHGTGLGLAMAFGILRQNGGAIFVDSELGKGSVFQLYLPVAHDGEIPDHASSNDNIL